MRLQADGWLGVEARHLATLAAIAETRSFRAAAEELGYVQSAVSQQLARLEKLVGARLVERTRGHAEVEITEAGRLLLGHAEHVLARLGAAQADLERHLAGDADGLRVGLLPSVATEIWPALLAELGAELPAERVWTTEQPDDRALFEAVEAGSLDAAFGELPLLPGPFESRSLLTDQYVLLVPADSPLAGPSATALAPEQTELPLVARPGRRLSEQVEAGLRAAGLRPRQVQRADSDAAAAALVAAGLGSAVLPRASVDEADPRTRVVALEGLPARRLVLFWHRDREPMPALEALVRAAEASRDRSPDTITAPRSRSAATPRARPARGRRPAATRSR